MNLLAVLTITLCIAHGIQATGFFLDIVRGASKTLSELFGVASTDNNKIVNKYDPCTQNVKEDYQTAQSNFYKKLYARIAARSDNHFVFSPSSIWLSLSALAEGADISVQSQLFNLLNLPLESCVRKQFYEIALTVQEPGHDVNLHHQWSLLLDENLQLNPDWSQYVKNTGLLDVATAPIKTYPQEIAKRLQQFLGLRSDINFKGNSILLDSLDYQGLWTTAFGDASTYKAPFYNEFGQQIGSIELMKAKRLVRLAQVPLLNTKVLELPVGSDGRYTMLFLVGSGSNVFKNAIELFLGAIYKIFNLLELTIVPVDIAVPKFILNSEFDVRPALEDLGFDKFWNDPSATISVSTPAALPGSFIQRTSINIESGGVAPVPSDSSGIIPGLVNLASNTASDVLAVAGRSFIADRPFMFALFDTATQTCIFAGAYSKPNTL